MRCLQACHIRVYVYALRNLRENIYIESSTFCRLVRRPLKNIAQIRSLDPLYHDTAIKNTLNCTHKDAFVFTCSPDRPYIEKTIQR